MKANCIIIAFYVIAPEANICLMSDVNQIFEVYYLLWPACFIKLICETNN